MPIVNHERTYTKVVRDVVCKSAYCDICGGRIYTTIHRGGSANGDVEYYTYTTGHYDWGNDSIDSVVNGIVCTTCAQELLNKYFKRARSGRGTNTEYVELYHHYCMDFGEFVDEGETDLDE